MADVKQSGPGADAGQPGLARTEANAGAGGAAGGAVGQARAMASQVQARVMAIPPQRRVWLMGGVLFLAAGLAAVAWYFERPDYRVLFSGLDAKDVQTVSQELAAAGIPFSTTPDGAGVQVPADSLDKARMEVAAKGMPQTGRLGFELFDKPNWVGSEFDEKVNYQRALEGELEHTIGSLGEVRTARVHLVLPQQSLFTSQDKVAKASVVLKLRKATLSQEQIESIRGLVAGAVENLSTDNVTLVDADGRVNLQAKGRGSAAEADMEQALETKLIAMLEPLAGRDNVRATVNVSYDEGSVEKTDEVYDKDGVVPLTSKKSEQLGAMKPVASGVPGTASNTPTASPTGSVAAAGAAVAAGQPPLLKEQLPVYPTAGGGGGSMKEESETYGVTRHVTHSEMGPGRIRRVTAAVVVNDKQGIEGSGKTEHTIWKPRSAEEMKRFEQLAQAAVGFDDKRGDQVVMSNVSFNSNVPEVKLTGFANVAEEAKTFVATQPGLLRTGMMGLVALLAVMFVLRPVATQVTAALKAPVLLASGSPTGSAGRVGAGGGGYSTAALTDGESAGEAGVGQAQRQAAGQGQHLAEEFSGAKRRPMKQGQVMFEHVADQIVREPVQSTRLLETWIGTGEGD